MIATNVLIAAGIIYLVSSIALLSHRPTGLLFGDFGGLLFGFGYLFSFYLGFAGLLIGFVEGYYPQLTNPAIVVFSIPPAIALGFAVRLFWRSRKGHRTYFYL